MNFWLWIIILITSLFIEVITTSALVSIWFSIGAVFSLICYFLNFNFTIQVLCFFFVSLLSIAVFRPIVKSYLRGNIIKTNFDRVIGMQARLKKAITEENLGELKINGLIWNARSFDNKPIAENTLVEIKAIEGSKLIVKKID